MEKTKCSHLFLLNSANVSLLLSTISDSYAKMENQDTAGRNMASEFIFVRAAFFTEQCIYRPSFRDRIIIDKLVIYYFFSIQFIQAL